MLPSTNVPRIERMAKSEPPVRWAPRVHPNKLKRLYELDAQGILDDDLIDEVGYTLYSRCQSILHVSDAMNGKVHCPQCDTIILHQTNDSADVLACPTCGWEARWGAYYNTYRTQELGAGGAVDIFHDFMAQWERVRTSREKMVLIDQLIHRWHWETQHQRPKFGLGRPTGVNLIEGNKQQVLALLDTLTYGAGSTTDTQTTKAAWRAYWQEVQEHQAAGHAARQAKRAARERRNEAEQS
jgi:Zn ribbon nucleic-acid-binding protein